MNAAALKVNLRSLKPGAKIIANVDGFDTKNLRLANYPEGVHPLEDGSLDSYDLIKIDVTKMTREALKEFTDLGIKEKDRAKTCLCLDSFTGCITVTSTTPSTFAGQVW